jgi:hypothetical protein
MHCLIVILQDFIVKAVHQVLFETISSFKGDLGKEDELRRLVDRQFISLQEAFKVSTESSEDVGKSIALKLLNLYSTGRLGHYTLDHVPKCMSQNGVSWLPASILP